MGNQDKKLKCPQCYSSVAEESRYCHKCGFSLEEEQKTLTYTPPMEGIIDDRLHFFPGDSFGTRYRIVEEIGRGGMGRVYKAEDKELEITVALKMIRPEYSSHPRFIQQFKKETLLARSISQENVIRIHDLGEVDDIKFISMDYIKGQNLKELIQTSGTLTADTTVNITKQICAALRAAHQKGIVHLDLKPRNIMIDSDGRVFVMDFGVAKSVVAREEGPSKGIIGTPPYISPEQAKREKVDQRSDVYSLGIIIFEMLTGKRPFEAETSSGYIEKHLYEKPPLPSKINPLIPLYLERIILCCLEKDRNKRYQSVEAILEDLERERVETRPFFARPRAGKLWRWAYLIPIVFIIAVGIYLILGRKKPVTPVISEGGRIPLAVMYFENNTGDDNFDHWRKALSDLIIQDLSQSIYIRVITGDRLFSILRELDLEEVKTYSSEDLKKIAAQGGVHYILYGNYTQAKDTFRINTMLQNIAIGDLVGSKRVEGIGVESFYTMVDQLTPWVKSQFKLTRREIAADFDRNIGDIITSKPEALKFYILGKQYYQEGRYQESNEAFMKAVEIDPEFALAYKRISENYAYLSEIDQARKSIQKSLSLMEHVSDRERYLVQGFAYTILEESYEKAIETYQRMLQYFPDDEDGNIYLGALYRNLEEWDLAIEQFEKILHINPEIAIENLVLIYKSKGEYERAKEILHSNQHVLQASTFHLRMSQIYLCQGQYERAQIELENALSLEKDNYRLMRSMANLHHILGNFQEAESILKQLLEKDDPFPQLSGQLWLGYLYLTQGKYEKCKNEVIQGINNAITFNLKPIKLEFLLLLAYINLEMKHFSEAIQATEQAEVVASEINFSDAEIFALHLRGLAYLMVKEMDKAKSTADQLMQLIEKTRFRKLVRHYYHLMGEIAQEEGMIADSILNFKNAVSLLPYQRGTEDEQAFYLYPLASVYYQNGDLEEARIHFEKIISLTTGRLHWGDIFAQSFYWLGKIYQKKGWIGKALEHYKTFLKLWEDADPGFPQIKDVKIQLNLLGKESSQ